MNGISILKKRLFNFFYVIRLFLTLDFLDTGGIFPYYLIDSLTPCIYAVFPNIIIHMDMSTDITF